MFPPPRNRAKKTKRDNRRILLRVGAGVLAVVILILLGNWIFGTRNYSITAKALRFKSTYAYTATEKSILFIRDTTLTCIDYADNEKWSVDLKIAGMKVDGSNELSAVYDKTHVQIYTANGDPLANKEFYGTVTQVRCGKTLTAVLNTDFENKNRVILLDKTGAEVNRYEFEDKYILDFGFYEGDSFYIYMLDGGSVVPVSRLMTYGKNLVNTGNISIESQILQHLVFLSDKLYAVGTNQIIQMDYVGVRKGEKLIYGWEYKDDMIKNGVATFLMIPGGETGGKKVIPTARILQIGESDVFAQMPSATIEVSLNSNRMYAYTAKKIRVLSLKGETISEHDLPFEATKFVPLPTKTNALCIVGEAVYIITLP